MKKLIRYIILILIIFTIVSCVEKEKSLFENRNIAISYDLDIVNPLDGCRCIKFNDLVLLISIEGKTFELIHKDYNADVGIKDVMIAQGDYSDVKQFVIAIKNGDNLTQFINKIKITIITTRSCVEQIQKEVEGKPNNKPGQYKIRDKQF